MPDMEVIKQSGNLYAYCMNNPIRYVDFTGNKAGDLFKTMDEAAIDFAKEVNGISIKERVEYAAYFYVEYKIEPFLLFWEKEKKYYSYTEPHTQRLEGFVGITKTVDPVSGKVIAGAIRRREDEKKNYFIIIVCFFMVQYIGRNLLINGKGGSCRLQ